MITEQVYEIIARNKLRHEKLKKRYKGRDTCKQWPRERCNDCEPLNGEDENFCLQVDDRHNTAQAFVIIYQGSSPKLGQNQRKIKYIFDEENGPPSMQEIVEV